MIGHDSLYVTPALRYDESVRMKLSTQTIVVLGLVQCVVLTLILILFFRYQQSLQSAPSADTPSAAGIETGK